MKSLPVMFICALLLGLCIFEKRAKELDMQRIGTPSPSEDSKSEFVSEESAFSKGKDSLAVVPEVTKINFPLASEIILLKN